jgi:hypothetical protein
MTQITEPQTAIFNMLKKGICESVEAVPVNKGAIEITTPFIDWKGFPLSIYVTHDGKITDGGGTINQLRALRVYEDFEGWVFQKDYFNRYQIQDIQGRLEPVNPESVESLITYLQGIARLPSFFEPKPIRSPADTYPTQVKEIVVSGLIEEYQLSIKEAEKYTLPRPLKLKNDLQIQSDLSPKRENIIIKIISHATSIATSQKEHVSHKILEPVLLKKDNINAEACIILGNLDDYPLSRKLIKEESDIIIETIKPNSKQELARMLAEA